MPVVKHTEVPEQHFAGTELLNTNNYEDGNGDIKRTVDDDTADMQIVVRKLDNGDLVLDWYVGVHRHQTVVRRHVVVMYGYKDDRVTFRSSADASRIVARKRGNAKTWF